MNVYIDTYAAMRLRCAGYTSVESGELQDKNSQTVSSELKFISLYVHEAHSYTQRSNRPPTPRAGGWGVDAS